MRKLTWVIAAISIAIWTLLSIGGYAVVHGAAQWITLNAEFVSDYPEVSSWLLWAVDLLRDVGVFVLAGVWAIVAFGIVIAAWLLQRGTRLLQR